MAKVGKKALPAGEKKPAYVPTGKPRGRKALPPGEKKPAYVPTGKPRGNSAAMWAAKKLKKQQMVERLQAGRMK